MAGKEDQNATVKTKEDGLSTSIQDNARARKLLQAATTISYTNSGASSKSAHDGVLGGTSILQFEIYIVKILARCFLFMGSSSRT
ncbi:Serine/threonine-protein kinase [Rhizina undulata]